MNRRKNTPHPPTHHNKGTGRRGSKRNRISTLKIATKNETHSKSSSRNSPLGNNLLHGYFAGETYSICTLSLSSSSKELKILTYSILSYKYKRYFPHQSRCCRSSFTSFYSFFFFLFFLLSHNQVFPVIIGKPRRRNPGRRKWQLHRSRTSQS